MRISVDTLKVREEDDPEYADYWLEISHTDSGIRWEIPLNKEELERIYPSLPKFVRGLADKAKGGRP